jgi:DNA-binding response OmpR family regulator
METGIADLVGPELVEWPIERELRNRLAVAGVPRLLVVSENERPPRRLAPDEAWIAAPFDRDELSARVHELAVAIERFDRADPWIDSSGVAHRGDVSVTLTAKEASVARALFAASGGVVPRDRLEAEVAPDRTLGDRTLEGVIHRLRRRLIALHLVVRSERTRGYRLITGDACATAN